MANRRKTWVAAAAIPVLALCGCTDQTSAHFASVSNDGRTIGLGTNSCGGDLTVEFVEDSETVRVSVTDHKRRLPFGSRGDCSDGILIHLAEPLDDRDLVDAVSGEVIRAQRNP